MTRADTTEIVWRVEIDAPTGNRPDRPGSWPRGYRATVCTATALHLTYFDTPDRQLELHGVRCCCERSTVGQYTAYVQPVGSDVVIVRTTVSSADPADWFAQSSALRAAVPTILAGPHSLQPILELCAERVSYHLRWRRWPAIVGQLETTHYGVHDREGTISWWELTARERRARWWPTPSLLDHLEQAISWRPRQQDVVHRVRTARELRESQLVATQLRRQQEVVVVLLHGTRLGLLRDTHGLTLPWDVGHGEQPVRHHLATAFGTGQAQLRRLGGIAPRPWRAGLDVWLARRLPARIYADPRLEWLEFEEVLAQLGAGALREPRTLAALHLVSHSDMRAESDGFGEPPSSSPTVSRMRAAQTAITVENHDRFLDADLSLLAFHERVFTLARDSRRSPAQRLEYLSIVAGNLDEFFMVRVGALSRAMQEAAAEGRRADAVARQRDAVRLRAHTLHLAVFREICEVIRPELEASGVRLRRWLDLDPPEQRLRTAHFLREIAPRLQPFVSGPRHPFPHLASAETALAVTLRDPASDDERVAVMLFPPGVPRAIPLEQPGDWILVEELVCAHANDLFPGLVMKRAHMFRVTRSADVRYDDTDETDALHLVAETIGRRPFLPVVRLEVDRHMPDIQRSRLLQEFRFEVPDHVSVLEEADVVEIDDLMSLHGLREVVSAIVERPERVVRDPFADVEALFPHLAERECLVYFPYESFGATAVRLLDEAANDPQVESIEMTLYRTGDKSPVLDALLRASSKGKRVLVVVELKARFDEARNIETVNRLRRAGVQVVLGVAGLKVHAKLLLIRRGEADGIRRYAYIGSGNFNPVTASRYTDVGLFTTREPLMQDLEQLLAAMRGAREWPTPEALLLSPDHLHSSLLALIDREIAHAHAGHRSGIRLKVNGLDEPGIVDALYRASAAGVSCELIVRGICTLRPGVPGLSENIRVRSILGEFLEHARILQFENGGSPQYFLGSADLRERNLHRRVEVFAPVSDPSAIARLARILDIECNDPTAFTLQADGRWRPGAPVGDRAAAQQRFIAEPIVT